ncbi:MAG: hypothetical protein B7Y86_12500 [Brevundimonas subvibrioides]|uniref:Uncharacterized protein n=1 Tax=Brevundimonas subvibrioides TaxID=74313 RepID=A0A258HGN1_9CAUL|nr:hypothetical protein [Brevundimonas subvibrioides]OYX55764.1 MAG: hypothetical protein B7Y86_12500 [Brevundimonas subvibrioides]
MISLADDQLPAFSSTEVGRLLEDLPSVRGFWLDDELLAATGLTSVPLLRKVQGLGLLDPKYVAMSVGGRRRVWTFKDVLLVQLLVEFAKRARIPVQSAVDWMLRPGRDWLVAAADLDGLIDDVLGSPPDLSPYVGSRFIIVDMTDVWFETERDLFERSEIDAPGPEVEPLGPSAQVASFLDVLNHAGTALVVDLAAIELTVCDDVKAQRAAHTAQEWARS